MFLLLLSSTFFPTFAENIQKTFRKEMIDFDKTIAAISTAQGGAIGIVRMSGNKSLQIAQTLFSKAIKEPRKVYFGNICDNGRIVDEVVLCFYKAPASYTGEDVIEICCHGSSYITGEILRLLISNGASAAGPGEFTKRAFLAGKMDLSAAEAVGDLIAAESRAAAEVALSQMRGGYSLELAELRKKLLHIAALFELELDFSEEDVEFASRKEMTNLLEEIKNRCDKLTDSFAIGNAIKNGFAVAIAGKPNVGKSTLLNALVGSDRSIVSEKAGTTRDFIDETVTIDGILFRFIDTAGLRQTSDDIEAMGVQRSLEQLHKATVIINMTTPNEDFQQITLRDGQKEIRVINKSDYIQKITDRGIQISAKHNLGIDILKNELVRISGWQDNNTIVSNARHYELLKETSKTVNEILDGIKQNLPADMLSHLLHNALQSLGTITGEFTTDELLGTIFANFCIGK